MRLDSSGKQSEATICPQLKSQSCSESRAISQRVPREADFSTVVSALSDRGTE